MDNLAVVVIPIYKQELTYLEKVSLRQADIMLKKYKKVFAAPDSLSFDYGIQYDVARFSDKYFTSTAGYSELLMSSEFYARFTNFQFMLIYQLDAFVFSDQLEKFCKADYDYIGAPIKGGDWRHYHVGNGGLSLRNINSAIKVLKNKELIAAKIRTSLNPSRLDEDIFFGYCGSDREIDFNVPSARYAAMFAAQNDYAHGLRDIAKRGLPFGCHYWWGYNYDFWKPHIESYGYCLPKIITKSTIMNDRMKRLLYLAKRYVRNKRPSEIEALTCNILQNKKGYYMYGGGIWGKLCIDFFDSLPIHYKIYGIYDNNPKNYTFGGYPVIKPTTEEIKRRNGFIIISTLYYCDEVEKQLMELGLHKQENYCSIFEICSSIVGDSIDINRL